jgi:hypothetical protein
MNPTACGIKARAALPLAVLMAASASLTAPVQPPRVYTSAAADAAATQVETMPSDSPIIRD